MRIRLHRIWKIVPVPIVTLQRMPGRLVGLCVGPFVVVREDYADDYPTIIHELTHCKQFWRGWALLHLVRYYGSKRYRLEAELEAFRAEVAACTPGERLQRLHESARSLASSYSLDLDTETCRLLLSDAPWPSESPRRRISRPHPEQPKRSFSLAAPARMDRRQPGGVDRRARHRPVTGQEGSPGDNRRHQIDRRAPHGSAGSRP